MTTKLNLEAGPELDDLIATKIFGLEKDRGIWTYWQFPQRWVVYDRSLHEKYLRGPEEKLSTVYRLMSGQVLAAPPEFSSEESWAFTLVRVMRKDGFSFKLWQPNSNTYTAEEAPVELAQVSFVCPRGPCEQHGNPNHNHHGAYNVEAETVPLAIARAALFARKVT